MTTIPVRYIDTTNYIARVGYDEWNESPRDWDNLGTMLCAHRDYVLGDEQVDTSEYDNWNDVKDMLIKERDAIIVLPLGLYDHSGITMYIGDTHDRWDGGQVGFIYVTREELYKEYNVKRLSKKILERAEKVLRSEVDTYDTYLRGDIYHVTIETESGREVDTLSGLYGNEGVDEFIKETIGDAHYEVVTL